MFLSPVLFSHVCSGCGEGHIPVLPDPEVEQFEKKVIVQGGLVSLVKGYKQQERWPRPGCAWNCSSGREWHLLQCTVRLATGRILEHVFQEGFLIPYEDKMVHFMSKNLKSIKGMEERVRNQIQKEIEGGHISDPHKSLPMPNLCVSLLGVVPRKTPGEFRLIHYLSISERKFSQQCY